MENRRGNRGEEGFDFQCLFLEPPVDLCLGLVKICDNREELEYDIIRIMR